MTIATRRLVQTLASLALLAGMLPAAALATAPLASELGVPDRKVLWRDGTPVTLVARGPNLGQCLASDPDSLVFALGYLAGVRDPKALKRAWQRAQGADLLARLSAPDLAEVRQVLASWPKERVKLLDGLAEGLNLAARSMGVEERWSREKVAALALQEPVLAAAGDWEEVPAQARLTVRLGAAAKDAAWGPALTSWAAALFPWIALDGSQGGAVEDEQSAAFFSWVEVNPAGGNPLLWVDEAGGLGLVYRAPPLPTRLEALGKRLDRSLFEVSPSS
ncbi:MAG: hypothetical protein M1602_06405 [Firmicutes bacterium]|nr:hypothetical protein [Bacillota bacterium]